MGSVDKESQHIVESPRNGTESLARVPDLGQKTNFPKPVSPHKKAISSIGRLSFLQSDIIDENFRHVHTSHEEILSWLSSLEAQSRQTQVDVEQLYERSKNNNQSLNKVLGTIAEYSKEVSEEGNATKTDVGKILDSLYEIQQSMKVEDVVKQLYASQEETQRQLTKILCEVSKENTSTSTDYDDLSGRLSMIESQFGGLKIQNAMQNTFGEFINKVDSLAQENSQQVNAKLNEVLGSLQQLNKDKNPEVSDLLRTSRGELSEQIESSSTRLETLLKSQAQTIAELLEQNKELKNRQDTDWAEKQTKLLLEHDSLLGKHQELQKSCFDLELKYTKLEAQFEAKLELFSDLQSQFLKLGEDSEALQKEIDNFNIDKNDRVPELERIPERPKRIITPLQLPSRVVSMPMNETTSRDIVINNSDEEEFV